VAFFFFFRLREIRQTKTAKNNELIQFRISRSQNKDDYNQIIRFAKSTIRTGE